MATGTNITAQRAQEFNIPAQQPNETDEAFRTRVSGVLRGQGHIIEAHEAYQNALYDQDENAMTGIFGAVAQALNGKDYSPDDPQRQVGDDIAAGVVASSKKPKMDADMLLAYLALFGGNRD